MLHDASFQVRRRLAHAENHAHRAKGSPCPDARDELLGSEDVAVAPLLEPSPEEEDLLVPQFLVVTVIEQAGGSSLDVRYLREVDPEDARRTILLGMAADAVGVPFTVTSVQNSALEQREVLLDFSPHGRPPLVASRSRRQARRESGAASRRCRASCSTSPWGNESGRWSRTSCLLAESSRSSSSTPPGHSGSCGSPQAPPHRLVRAPPGDPGGRSPSGRRTAARPCRRAAR